MEDATRRQIRFEWGEEAPRGQPDEVVLDAETTRAALTLMARALVAVVRAAEDSDDER
jgi:hypothetical protein